jgi:hypothetical protein
MTTESDVKRDREAARVGHGPMMHTPLARQPIHYEMHVGGSRATGGRSRRTRMSLAPSSLEDGIDPEIEVYKKRIRG